MHKRIRCFRCASCVFVAVYAQAPADMVLIPAGEFWMGRQHMWLIDELGMHLRLRLDDQPSHLTYISDFYIDKYEVTNEKYAQFVQATKRRKPFHWVGGKFPQGSRTASRL